MALLRGLLVLSLSCLQGPCFTFSPVSAVDLPGQQPVSEQAQQKLPLPALFKLDNQDFGDHATLKRSPGHCKSVPTAEETRRLAQANLTWDTLYHPSLQERPTKVWLPKLHLQQQLDLVATLSQLGLQELFQGPDLRGISEQNLVVSSVQHQSTMELSEAGVEAAAATSVAMNRMSLSSFTVNRPFLFFIMEDTIGVPLFVGSVRNPNPSALPQLQEQRDSPDNRLIGQNDKADFHGGKTFGPDLKLAPRMEEDYPQFSSPK